MDFSQFKAYLEAIDRSPKTINGYLRDLNHFARWFKISNGISFTPQDLTKIDGREYRQFMTTVEKASPATVNRKLSALRAYGEWAVNTGVFDTNPNAGLRGVREQNPGIRWLEKREQAALLRQMEKEVNAAKTDAALNTAVRNRCIVILLLNTGVRISELCALNLDDIDLFDRKGQLTIREGKGRKTRSVPLNHQARTTLTEWLKIRPQANHTTLFSGRRGNGLTPNAVQRFLSELGRVAGIEVTPHSLRHTFCKNLINAGVSLEKVAALAGHESIQSTRRYVEPGAVDLERAVAMLEE